MTRNTSTVSTVITRAALPVSAALCGLLLNPVLRPVEAQDRMPVRPRVETITPGGRVTIGGMNDIFSSLLDSQRSVIGVTMSAAGRSDTLGVLIGEITAGGPADKAGLKEGARITAVNGVSLRVSAADADDEEMRGIGQRRLQREVGKANPGEEVELRVFENGQSRTLRLKTVSASDLNSSRTRVSTIMPRESLDKRASLGASIGSSGNVRDTLGLFVSSVISKGPAETAGIIEGDRIASINGADVRVAKEDAEDSQATMARMNRFSRELAKLAPGDKVTLKVYSSGRYHDVQVTAGKSSELRGSGSMRFNFADPPVMMSVPKGSSGVLRRGSSSK